MDAARPEAALRDLKPAAFAEQHVGNRHANVGELDFGMAVRSIIKAKHRQHADHFNARRIKRHEHLALLRMTLGFKIGFAHHNGDFAARVTNA